ncbi:hypothetical protein H6G96_39890 [Nostoc sp. FACHB-892]|nr:hypothetical protein [Nostoc sp. FACHB-892]MBD2732236.1 hypothetical protein [Nostoc sp. FACHB-892]
MHSQAVTEADSGDGAGKNGGEGDIAGIGSEKMIILNLSPQRLLKSLG